jgi:signal transduction histidine kinase
MLYLNYFLSMYTEYAILAGLIALQIYRYKWIFNAEQKRQTKWVVFGACTAALLTFADQQLPNILNLAGMVLWQVKFISEVMQFIALFLIPLSIGIAILHSRLWDIDLIIRRMLVYGLLSTCVVGLYMLVVGGLGTVLQAQGNVLLALVATGLVAVIFHPLRIRLQSGVNYLVYGERHDPYRVLSLLNQRLEATLASDAVLPTIVESIAHAFKLPYAAILLPLESQPAAEFGQKPEKQDQTLLQRLPFTYQGEVLGVILLATDPSGEDFSGTDKRLLEDLVRHTGSAVHALRLSQAITRSREQLVLAREEERRRLRRDLHDGLGPQLASLSLQLSAVHRLLNKDPEAAEQVLSGAMMYTQEAVKDVRRLVYGLRPPVLDDLGLVVALREDIQRNQASGLTFSLHTPEQLPLLPAAVEVACYRIAQEAITNVLKHAQASCCTVRLWLDKALNLEVIDNGRGLTDNLHTGVGLTSMCERAHELGGDCTIEPLRQGGTRVWACLPLS